MTTLDHGSASSEFEDGINLVFAHTLNPLDEFFDTRTTFEIFEKR